MNIVLQVADWIKVIGSFASVGLAIYFIYKAISTRILAKKPIRDAKKRERLKRELAEISHELGLDKDPNKKD